MTQNSKVPQRCAVVLCHPRADSFCAAVAKRAVDAARAVGQETVYRDLYAMAFDPVVRAEDLAVAKGGAPAPDVDSELSLLDHPSAVILVYPVWFGSPPALLKGYVERVLGCGSHGPDQLQGASKRVMPLVLITIATSAMSSDWLQKRSLGAAGSAFGAYLADALGIYHAEHLALDGVTERMTGDQADAALTKVSTSVTRWLTDQHERWATLVNFTEPTPSVSA